MTRDAINRTTGRTAVVGTALLLGCVSEPAASQPADDRKGPRLLQDRGLPARLHPRRHHGRQGTRRGGRLHGRRDRGRAARSPPRNLAEYDAVVFLSTTGDVLDAEQQTAFEGYIRNGGGYVGIHAAADTEYDWAFYGGLAGAYFQSHPAIQPATVDVEDRAHPATPHLARTWDRTDEWYNYRSNPRDRAHVLASLDESSYSGGTMNGDHPIAWCQDLPGRPLLLHRRRPHQGVVRRSGLPQPPARRHPLGHRRGPGGLPAGERIPSALRRHGSLGRLEAGGPGLLHPGRRRHAHLVGRHGHALVRRPELGSYSLKLDWKMAARRDDNSGIFVGFPPSDDPWSAVDNGYEIQIDATDVPEKTTGSVYGFQSADLKKRDQALNPPGEWNTYEIRVEGERLRVYLNGVKINDFTNTDPARSLRDGHVGIQNHGADDQVSFRDIRMKELPAKPRPARTASQRRLSGGGRGTPDLRPPSPSLHPQGPTRVRQGGCP